MGPILYCDRCRGMEVGWNRKYLTHKVLCQGEFSKSFKLFVYTVTAAIVISVFPTATATVFSNQSVSDAAQVPLGAVVERAPVDAFAVSSISDPSVLSIDSLLDRNSRLSPTERARVARSVVTSARKYDVDPYLISSMLLVESSGNPFAISRRDAVGIMQIHVPTWGDLIDREGINLFQVEDNIDLGTRILKEYTGRYGLWDGVIRYLGAGGPTEEAMEYVSRVQDIYTDRNAD
jgi:hypothetical protein